MEIVNDIGMQKINNPEAKLKKIAEALNNSKKVDPVTVRQLLGWFGAERRTLAIAARIRDALRDEKLSTKPDFQYAYIDGNITFVKADPGLANGGHALNEPNTFALQHSELINDPNHRIGKLPSANIPPTRVAPNAPLLEAATIMLSQDFSQLPVMTSDREVKGVITWESMASRIVLGAKCEEVRDCMEIPYIVDSDLPVFEAIDSIVRNQYVLVRETTGKITGIVTSSDLAEQFKLFAEPFLLLGVIEHGIRWIIDTGHFTTKELAAWKSPADAGRKILRIADFTMGECRRFLEDPNNWEKLGITADRKIFIRQLERVIRTRNDVMHFDPDGISPEELSDLKHFSIFLQKLIALMSKNNNNKT